MIDLGPLLTQVVAPLAIAALTPVVSWIGWKAAQLLHLKVTQSQAQILEAAMQNGINFAVSKVTSAAAPKAQIDTKSWVVQTAVNYVLPKVPQALSALGVTPESLAQRIEARLPPLPADAVLTSAGADEAPH